LSYKSLKSRKQRIFLPTSYIQGQVRKTKEAVESAKAGLLPQEGDVKKERRKRPRKVVCRQKKTKEGGLLPQEGDVRKRRKEKKKTIEGKKVAPAKARFHVPYTRNFFFGSRVFGVGSGPSW
jgi:hypothetical protein